MFHVKYQHPLEYPAFEFTGISLREHPEEALREPGLLHRPSRLLPSRYPQAIRSQEGKFRFNRRLLIANILHAVEATECRDSCPKGIHGDSVSAKGFHQLDYVC